MNRETIQSRLERTSGWYHIIELAPGVFTPGLQALVPQWEVMRRVRDRIDYRGKFVLDIASFDGMWAFDAERLGAQFVVATDCIHLSAYRNFLFARQCLNSSVLPFYNIAAHRNFERLDVVFDDIQRRFDIVHHLGLFYHLRDPLASLSQARSCLLDGGTLFFETAIINQDFPGMMFNGPPPQRIYCDHTTHWVPSMSCVREILDFTLFEIVEDSILVMPQNNLTSRACMLARARPINSDQQNDREISRQSRNMGIDVTKAWLGIP